MPLKMLDSYEASYFANDSATPVVILDRLSQHNDVRVRIAVAKNKNTHAITALQLAQDDNPELRYALAENQQIDSGVLNILAADKNPLVADRALQTISLLKQTITADNWANKTYEFSSPEDFDPELNH